MHYGSKWFLRASQHERAYVQAWIDQSLLKNIELTAVDMTSSEQLSSLQKLLNFSGEMTIEKTVMRQAYGLREIQPYRECFRPKTS